MASLKRNNVNRRKFDRKPIDVDDLTSASSFSGIRDVIESHFGKPETSDSSQDSANENGTDAPRTFETDPTRLQYVWEPNEVPISVRLSVELIDRLEKQSIEIFRAITNRGSEIGGILLGRVLPGKPLTVLVEDYEPIACAYDLGPSFVLTPEEQQSAHGVLDAKRAGGGLSVVGFFRSNTRAELVVTEDDLALFDQLFPEEHNIALLAKPFSRKPCQGAIFIRESGKIRAESSYLEFAFSRAELEKNGELQPAIRVPSAEAGRVTMIRPPAPPSEPEKKAPAPASVAPPAVPVNRIEPKPEPATQARVAPPPEPRVPPQSETKTGAQVPASVAAGAKPVWRFRPQTEARTVTPPAPEMKVEPPAPPAVERKAEPIYRPAAPPTPEVKAPAPTPPATERRAEPMFRPMAPPKPEAKVEPPTPPVVERKPEPAFQPMVSPKPEAKATPPTPPVVERRPEPAFRPMVPPKPEAKVTPPTPPVVERKPEPAFRPMVPPKPEAKVTPPTPPVIERKPEPTFRPMVSPKPEVKVTPPAPPAPERKAESTFRPMAPPKPEAKVEPPAPPVPERKPESTFRPMVRTKPDAKLVAPAPPATEPKAERAPKPAPAVETRRESAPAADAVGAVPDFRFGAEAEPQSSHRWLLVVLVVAILAGILGFLFLRPSRPAPARVTSRAPVTETAAPAASLALWAEGADAGIRIHWDGFAPAISSAQRGTLTVTDGTIKTKVDLGVTELKEGMYKYKPRSDDVTARLELDDNLPGPHATGTLRMLGARRMGPGKSSR